MAKSNDTDAVASDARRILNDVSDAWNDLPEHQQPVHEVLSYEDGSTRARLGKTVDVRFESLSPKQLLQIRERLDVWATNLAAGARARNTVDALRSDLKLFSTWCRNTARIPLPATQETLAAFLKSHQDSRKISSLRRYLASVATLHSAAGLTNPTLGELIRSQLDLIARQQTDHDKQSRSEGKAVRFAKRQAAPLRDDDLLNADALFGESLRDKRDRAIVWIAFDTLMRSSEIAAMRMEDLRAPTADGSRIVTLPHSKSDQYGAGQKRYISPFTALRLDDWLSSASIKEGYVFRGINTRFAEGGKAKKAKKKVDYVQDSASRQVIYRAIKQCAGRLSSAGLVQFDWAAYSAHSTRVGATQDMLAEGVSMLAVQQAGGWKTNVMPMKYAQEIDALHGGAAQLAKKRGRHLLSEPTSHDPEEEPSKT